MALSVADKIGNPIAAAKIYQQLLVENKDVVKLADALESLKTIGHLIDEALSLINKVHSIKPPEPLP